jgi:sugar (pentulose or hexulose) kinase
MGKLTLGIGDASGMFPINQTTLDYNEHMLQLFDKLNINSKVGPLKPLLPKVIRAGDDAGVLSRVGANLLGLTRSRHSSGGSRG